MAIKIDFKAQQRAIELPNGEILDIPERTKTNDDKVQKVIQNRTKETEFNFLVNILVALFGEKGLKKISSNIECENLDYLTVVYTTAVNMFYADKIEAEKTEMLKQLEQLGPLKDKFKAINTIKKKTK